MKSVPSRVIGKIGRIADTIRAAAAYRRIDAEAPAERRRFSECSPAFAERYRAISGGASPMMPLWQDFTYRLTSSLLPVPPWHFMRDAAISATMVMDKRGPNLVAELAHVKSRWSPAALKDILRENAAGHPRIADTAFLTSHNTVHHTYHIARFLDATSMDIGGIRNVVEWGGGYGNLAKLWRRIAPIPHSWTIIDLPILATLQWLYLSTVIGPEHVRLISHAGEAPLKDGVTIIPAHLTEAFPEQCDLFVSTWAISESPPALQEMVISRNWFNAKHLLLGYQDSNAELPTASRIGEAARTSGAIIEDIPHLAGSHYAFK